MFLFWKPEQCIKWWSLQASQADCYVTQQMKGDAEAFAIEAKAKAEAEQMAKKADAWKDYQDAAMVDMVLETLPKVSVTKYLSRNSGRHS